MGVVYAYFVFDNPDGQSKHCYVIDESNECQTEFSENSSDMTFQF